MKCPPLHRLLLPLGVQISSQVQFTRRLSDSAVSTPASKSKGVLRRRPRGPVAAAGQLASWLSAQQIPKVAAHLQQHPHPLKWNHLRSGRLAMQMLHILLQKAQWSFGHINVPKLFRRQHRKVFAKCQRSNTQHCQANWGPQAMFNNVIYVPSHLSVLRAAGKWPQWTAWHLI